jgi:hypothetical protein
MGLLVERLGVRRGGEVIDQWLKLRPDDPKFVEAKADLLREQG